MSAAEYDRCRDCGGTAHEIKLLGRGYPGLAYTLPEAKPEFWTSQFPVEGNVAAFLCESCGRIMLYGRAAKQE